MGRTPPVVVAPVADALLECPEDSHFVITECKAASFGVESDQARQARGFILAGNDISQRGLPIATGDAEVCYVVPGQDAEAMAETLLSLRRELQTDDRQKCGVGAIGIIIQQGGVYLRADYDVRGGGKLPADIAPSKRVIQTEAGWDPRPLYVIPWIPHSEDEDLNALREKLRSQLLSHIGRAPSRDVNLRFDALLDEVSSGVYSLWRDRQSLQGQVNTVVGSIIRGLVDGARSATVRASELSLSISNEEERQALMEHIRVANVPPKVPEGRQLPLGNTSIESDEN